MKKNLIISILVLSLSLSFYAQIPPKGWKGKIEYQDGVKVVIKPVVPLYGEIELKLEEDLVIGNEEDENFAIYRGVKVQVDNQGNIYVGNGGTRQIHMFNNSGEFIRRIGKRGQGPGEFEFLNSIHIDSDNFLYALDGFKGISIFNSLGEFQKYIKSSLKCY